MTKPKRSTIAYDLRFSTKPPMPYSTIAKRMGTNLNNVGSLIKYAEGCKRFGPRVSTIPMNIRITPEMDAQIRAMVKAENTSLSFIVRRLLTQALEPQCPN